MPSAVRSSEYPPRPTIHGLPEGSVVLGLGEVNNPRVERINGQYRFLGITPVDGTEGPMEDGWYMIADEIGATGAIGALVFIPIESLP